MPRYFFNLAPGHPIYEEGEQLPDDAAAIEAARQTAREMLRDGPSNIPDERVVVSNEKLELIQEAYLEEYAPTQGGAAIEKFGGR